MHTVEFRVLVPATRLSQQEQALRHSEHPGAVFGETGTVAVARMRLAQGLKRLAEIGIEADGDIGAPDPFEAVVVAVAHHPADEIILSTLPRRLSRWIAADLPTRLHRRLHLAVTHVETGQTLSVVDHGRSRRRRRQSSTTESVRP